MTEKVNLERKKFNGNTLVIKLTKLRSLFFSEVD